MLILQKHASNDNTSNNNDNNNDNDNVNDITTIKAMCTMRASQIISCYVVLY